MILALGHDPQVGKDQFVMFVMDDLRQRFKNLDIQREGFADRIYDICQSVYGWADFQSRLYYIQNPAEKEKVLPKIGKTPRQLVIGIAEKVREFDPKAWLRPVYLNRPKHVKFITDMRTFEEAETGRELGAYMLRIIRPSAPKIECPISKILTGWDGWHETLVNDGSLTEWREKSLAFSERKIVPYIQAVQRGDTLYTKNYIHG